MSQYTQQDLRDNFALVLFLVWRSLKLPDPTPIQQDIAQFLQYGPSKLMVMAFRGVGKSWITAAFVIWYLLNNPSANVVVVSANRDRATKFTTFVLRLIEEIPEFHHLRPKPHQRSSSLGFDVGIAPPSQTQSVTSVGITGNMTGDRGDLIIFDDVEVPNNSETQTQRDKIADRTREASALLKPGGRIVYLGTPQCEDSIYAGLPERGYHVRVWPILFPTEAQLAGYEGMLAPMLETALRETSELVGTSTEPGRFDEQDIEERRRDYGERGFALQFMLDPSLSDVDKYPLKLSNLLVTPLDHVQAPTNLIYAPTADNELTSIRNVGLKGDRIYQAAFPGDPTYEKYGLKMMTIDPSGRGRDETAYAVGGSTVGRIYALDAGGVMGVDEEHLEKLCEIAAQYEVNVVACEPNYGGGTFTTTMRMALQRHGYECSVRDAEWARGQKEKRIIEILRPALGSRKLVVDQGLFDKDFNSVSHLPETEARAYRLFYQLTHITEDRGSLLHDDRVEAVAMLVHEMKRELGVDPSLIREKDDKLSMEQEIQRIMGRVNGRVNRPNFAPRV